MKVVPFRSVEEEIHDVVARAIEDKDVTTWLSVEDLAEYGDLAWENAEESSVYSIEDYDIIVADRVVRSEDAVHGFIAANPLDCVTVLSREYRRKTVLTEVLVCSNSVVCKDGRISFPCLKKSRRVAADRCEMIEILEG